MLGTRVAFSPMRKSTKNLPKGSPLWVLPLGGIIIPPAATSAAPPRKGCNSGQYVRNKTPAVPRIDSRECFPDGTEGKNKTDLPSNLKWQIGLFLWLKVARRDALASAARAVTPHWGIPKGAALGDSLVTFSSGRKSPGCRAWQSHALAERLQVGAGATSPAKAAGTRGGALT